MPGNALIEVRRGARTSWSSTNPVLGDGEPGFDETLKKVKWGDGSTAWNSLPYSGEDVNILNPRNNGAVGDGSTVDDAAFLKTFTDCVASPRNDFNAYGDYRLTKSIFVSPGTYLLNGNGKLMADVVTNNSMGLTFRGSGEDVTEIVFSPTAANGFAAFNNDRIYHIVFMNMSFHVAGANAATATLFKSYSNGHAQSYTFVNCTFSGTCKWGFALTGSNNNSEFKFTNCKFLMSHGAGNAFLYSPSPGGGGSDQFLNYQFTDCDIEYVSGDFVQMAAGGDLNITGGSLIHQGDGSQSSSSNQRFVSMLGNSHSAGCNNVSISNCRVEHRHNNSQILYSERGRGNIVLDNLDCETQAWGGLSSPMSVKAVEIVGSNTSFPTVNFRSSMLMGKQVYHYGSNSYQARPNIRYQECNFVDPVTSSKRAVDFFTFTADGGTTNIGGAPVVHIDNCHAEADSDYNEIFDCNLNWHTAINQPVQTRVAFFRGAAGGPTGGLTMKLPLNALITELRVSKSSGGTATGTNVTYTLTNGDGTTVGTTGSGGAAWNTAWRTSSGQLGFMCTTDNQRSLTINFANITETRSDLNIAVTYIG